MTTNSKNWTVLLAPFRTADNTRAMVEILVTVIPLVAVWLLLWRLLQESGLLSTLAFVLLLLPASGLMVRLFILQHDCGHGAMFRSQNVNNWVGRFLGVFTFTPYDYWRRLHANHHAASGDLDRRGIGDIDTLTVAEYKARNKAGKLIYRLYRSPIIMFGLGPSYLFLLRHRLPIGAMNKGLSGWVSTLATNAGIIMMSLLLIKFAGLDAFLLIQIPMVVLAASIGVWLFYVQHQYEETYWDTRPDWSHENGALQGSSYYELPRPIMWITGNIGIHHVHHLSSRIPFYNLPKVMKAHPELKDVGRLTFLESLRCVNLALWDESAKRLISFRDARRLQFT